MRQIPLIIPWLGEEEVQAAQKAILSGWVTQGPQVKAFEDAFAAYTGAAHACAVSSCTTALHLALLTVGVKPGDVVITVSHSFIATANSIRHCQAEPVFIDVDPATFNLDPAELSRCLAEDFEVRDNNLWYRDVAKLITGDSPLRGRTAPLGRLAALLIVHQVGLPADLERLLTLAQQYRIPVVEDAACAIGSEISFPDGAGWEKIGRPHGDVACFSFHPRKIITTGDGGMLTTDSPQYDQVFRLLRHHGMDIPDLLRHQAGEVIFEKYRLTGFNYRMTDIQAAIGIEQVRRLPEIIRRRRTLAHFYHQDLASVRGINLPVEPPYARTNWQSYIIYLEDPTRQKAIMEGLLKKGISSRRGIMCAHREEPYCGSWPAGSLPNSEAAQDRGIILPMHPLMPENDIEYVVSALRILMV
ncbi:MAG: DegT/DnrJ/EryC1/StrS family aminotransferase [Deltaproteobacteria bacterium]|nr:MAG: DegT/DnrJ/EryC1/StrS family aminotransferase [Deltaproteobacteria bacterium]